MIESALIAGNIFAAPAGEIMKNLLDVKLYELVLKLNIACGKAQNSKPSARHSENITAALRFISENYKKPISVADMAGAANLGEGTFYSLFKRETGTTPHGYLVEKRLSYACRLLMFSDGTAV